MFNIADYLKRISGTIDKNLLYQKEISEIIKKHTGIEKDPASTKGSGEASKNFFEIKDGILRTNLSPAEKNMIFIKKEAILAELTPFGVKDIR